MAEEALRFFGAIYAVEAHARELDVADRARLRQIDTKPILTRFHDWLVLQRQRTTKGTPLSNAIDYSLRRWAALTRFADDGKLPPDNNHLENRMRPIALGGSNWLFAGSLRADQRAAAVIAHICMFQPIVDARFSRSWTVFGEHQHALTFHLRLFLNRDPAEGA